MFQIEYLGHSFNFRKQYEMCYCLKCNIRVYFPFEEEIYAKNIIKGNKYLYLNNYIEWVDLNLSCDEYIIKNIIE